MLASGDFGISEISLDGRVETGIWRFGPVPPEGRFAIVMNAGAGCEAKQSIAVQRHGLLRRIRLRPKAGFGGQVLLAMTRSTT